MLTVDLLARRFSLAFALAAFGLFAQAQASGSDYDIVCIHNSTDQTISFQYLGNTDSSWTSSSVRPGNIRMIKWQTSAAFHSLKIRFDADTTGDTFWQTYTVYPDAGPALNCNRYGSDYRFNWDFDEYIDLYED